MSLIFITLCGILDFLDGVLCCSFEYKFLDLCSFVELLVLSLISIHLKVSVFTLVVQ